MGLKALKFSFIFSLFVHMLLLLGLHISPYIGRQAVPVGVDIVYVPQSRGFHQKSSSEKSFKVSKKTKGPMSQKKVLKKRSSSQSSTLQRALRFKSFGRADGVRLNQQQKYMYQLRNHIVKYIDYPRAAARLGQTGEVIIRVDIHRSGRIIQAQIEKSCPFFRLNEAALKLVRSVGQFSPFPSVMTEKMITVSVPVSYTLK